MMKINKLKFIYATTVFAFIGITILHCNRIDYSQIRLIKEDNGLDFTPAKDISGYHPFMLNSVTFANNQNNWGLLMSICYRKTGLGPSSMKDVVYFIIVDEHLKPTLTKPLIIYDTEKSKDRKSCNIFPTNRGFGFIYTSDQSGALLLNCIEFNLEKMKSQEFCTFSFTYPDCYILKTGSHLLVASYHKGFVYIAKLSKGHDGITIMRSDENKNKETVLDIKKNNPKSLIHSADLYIDKTGVYIAWIEEAISSNSPQCKTPQCAAYFFAHCSLNTKKYRVKKLEISDTYKSYHYNLNVKFIHMNDDLNLFMQCVYTVWLQRINSSGRCESKPVKYVTSKSLYRYPDPFPVQVNISH